MADYDLDELRSLQRRARAAIAAAEGACAELRTIDGAISSVINRMLDSRPMGSQKRARSGPQQKEIARFLRSEGATPGAIWVTFRTIVDGLPLRDPVSLKGSLEDGRGRFFEQDGDAWQLLEAGQRISD